MMTAAILGMSREFSPAPPPLRSVRDSGSRFPVCNSGGAARRGGGRRGKRTGARDEIGIGGRGLQNTPPSKYWQLSFQNNYSISILKLTFLEDNRIQWKV